MTAIGFFRKRIGRMVWSACLLGGFLAAPAGAEQAILDVRDIDTPGSDSVLHIGGLTDNVSGFVDRFGQDWTDIPPVLEGADYIESAQDNADVSDDRGTTLVIEIDVAEGAYLYMFIEDSQPTVPFPWMNQADFGADWIDTGLDLTWNPVSNFSVWRTATPLAAGTYTFRQMPVDSSFYGIAGTNEGDDDDFVGIYGCNTAIHKPGHYKLMNDLVRCDEIFASRFKNAISILSDDVVLDLNGHSISCMRDPFFNTLSFGIFAGWRSNIEIRNGTISGCDLGIRLLWVSDSVVRNMVLAGNGNGLEMLAGANNKILKNKMMFNGWSGLVASTSFFDGRYVGPTSDHKIYKNLIVDNRFAGIDADGLENSIISCNTADRNETGISIIGFGSGNTIKKNIANYNTLDGIAAYGLIDGDTVNVPVSQGSLFRHNTAFGNARADLGEIFSNSQGDDKPNYFCSNFWKKNRYGTYIGAENCFGPPSYFDDDHDSCAPGYGDDEDDDYDDDGHDGNLLNDPGFEMRLAPDEGGWSMWGPSWYAFDQARTGYQSMFNGADGGVTGSVQEFPAEPGSQWRLTGYGLTPIPLMGEPAFGIVQFTFFDEFDNDLGTVETAGWQFPALPSNQVNAWTPVDQWIFLDTGIGTAPDGAVKIAAFTLYVDFAWQGFQGVYFDDLRLCAVDDDDDCYDLDDDDDDSDSD